MFESDRTRTFLMAILAILVSASWLIAENSACNVTIGSRFEVNLSGIDGIAPLLKKPKIYIKVNSQKVSAKVLEYDSDSITCEWKKKVTAGTYILYVWTKSDKEVAVSSSFTVEEPVITSISPCSGNTVDDEITMTGYYFGTKKPKLWLEYTVRGKTKKSKCKIKTPLEYPDIKGKTGKSCMDVDTGESKIVFYAPKGIDEDTEYILYLEDKIAQIQTAFNTDTFSVKGSVSGAVLEGVTITLSDGKGKFTVTTTTGVDGSFSFSEVENGIYTVTPSLTDHSFSPENQTVTVNGSDMNGINFRSQTDIKEVYFTDNNQELGNEVSHGVATGDLDGDGDIDVFVANSAALSFYNSEPIPNKVWLNDGTGNFTDSGQELGLSFSQSVTLGDLDGDGDLDAFVVNGDDNNDQGKPNEIWLNDGSGNFSDSGQTLGNSFSQTAALGDLDGDGDLDAFVANGAIAYIYEANKVWLNDGSGNFTDSGQELGKYGSLDVALGDLDGDGDLDAFVVNGAKDWGMSSRDDYNRVWLNDGNGNFTDSGQALGVYPSHHSEGVVLGDFDGDEDLDAFVVNGGINMNRDPNRLWLNDGKGNFTDSEQALGNSCSHGVKAVDFNGDGFLDVIVANGSEVGDKIENVWLNANRIWLNDGTGKFIDSGCCLGYSLSCDVAVGDFDGNGKPDAFIANGHWNKKPDKVWLNGLIKNYNLTISVDPADGGKTEPTSGTTVEITANKTFNIIVKPNPGFKFVKWSVSESGSLKDYSSTDTVIFSKDDIDVTAYFSDEGYFFTDSGQALGNSTSNDVALGDLDGDGDIDAVVTGSSSYTWVWLNDGLGSFTENQKFGSDCKCVSLSDLDGDGDLDAFIGRFGYKGNNVWLNDGKGTFTDTEQLLGNNPSRGVALGDLDGDGDMDAFMANGGSVYGDKNTVWYNDGKGNFTDSGQKLGSSDDYSYDVKLADLDGDGDLDAFVVAGNVCFNDGNGIFVTSDQHFSANSVALGDLDGDGDIDAFLADGGNSGGGDNNEVWLNDGTGNFTDSGQKLGDSNSWKVFLADLDNDNDLDAFVANSAFDTNSDDAQPNVFWENDGNGGFSASQYVGKSYSNSVALSDLNGDTSIDVFVANDGPDKVWFNRAKH